jgi:hypothetical protein
MKKQLIVEAARMQKLAGLIKENEESANKPKYNNGILKFDDFDDSSIYLFDKAGEEYPGYIEDNTVTFYITGIEDPYYDPNREENWEFPEVLQQILDAGGMDSLYKGDGYEVNVEIDLDVLKTLYPIEK